MSRDRRRMLLVDLLRRGAVATQDELVEALARSGEPVTQATVSRDLAAIGAVRGHDGYLLPDLIIDPGAAASRVDELMGIVRRHVVSVATAHAIVVARTAPGHAQMVASAFDRWPPEGVAGCVAGDDTIFLATHDPNTAARVAASLDDAIRGHAR